METPFCLRMAEDAMNVHYPVARSDQRRQNLLNSAKAWLENVLIEEIHLKNKGLKDEAVELHTRYEAVLATAKKYARELCVEFVHNPEFYSNPRCYTEDEFKKMLATGASNNEAIHLTICKKCRAALVAVSEQPTTV